MKLRIKNIFRLFVNSPREFPVEAAMGFMFFCISAWHTSHVKWNDQISEMTSGVNIDIVFLFVPLMVLTFWLHKVNRWVYMASGLLFLPLMALNLKPFLWTYGFAFTYVLAALRLLVSVRRMDNRSFAAHALHVVTQLFFGFVISGLLTGAIFAIVASFLYIFGIDTSAKIYEYILEFVWFFIAPQVCCTLVSQDEDEVREPVKVLRLILNFILSPAVIIYTIILYVYFIKIVLVWDLPKGGVAWMVMGFVTVALAGRLMQYVLKEHYYDWFYNNFTWIAIPPLIMYWIGSIYRINLYSFTESRFYLMVAGALMTLFVLMLLWQRTRKFQLMALIFGAAIILFTYIPGISAKSIGLSCQKQRLTQLISEMKLTDPKTGKLNDEIEDMRRIRQDSLLCEQYKDVTSVIDYVRHEIGTDEFKKQYGEWTHSEYSFTYIEDSVNVNARDNWYIRRKPIELGDYTIMLPQKAYQYNYNDQIVTITQGENNVVLSYPIQKVIRQDTMLLHHPEQLLTYRNDSLMLVLEGICIEDTVVTDVRYYGLQLFKKQVK